jgi:phage FluMu protein Com
MFLYGKWHIEKSCPNCRAAMKLESETPGFLSFECPKCAFVVIEVAKEDAPQRRAATPG